MSIEVLQSVASSNYKVFAYMNDTVSWDISGNRDVTKSLDLDPEVVF